MHKPKYKTLRDLLAHELVTEEDAGTDDLIKSLRHVKRDKVLTKAGVDYRMSVEEPSCDPPH